MKKAFITIILACLSMLFMVSCGTQNAELENMTSVHLENNTRGIVWENRTYAPFCVIPKNDRKEQIGYVDGDTDDKISRYKDYSPNEWLVNWASYDGGAFLLKEQSVTEIPDGLQAEY